MGKGRSMVPESSDTFNRLSEAIESWHQDLQQTHATLARQLAQAQEHLDHLLTGEGGTAAPVLERSESAGDNEKAAQIADLESRIQQLQDQLAQKAQSAEDTEAATQQTDEALHDAKEVAAEWETKWQQEHDQVCQLQEEIGTLTALKEQLESEQQDRHRLEEELQVLRNTVAAFKAADDAEIDAPATSASEAAPATTQEEAPAAPAEATADTDHAISHKQRMGEILVDQGIIEEEQLQDILEEQIANPMRRFGTIAVERGYTSEEVVAKILAAQLHLKYEVIDEETIEPGALTLISAHLAATHHCIPLRLEEDRLILAMSNPIDLIAIEDIELASKHHVEPVVATPSSVQAAIARYYRD